MIYLSSACIKADFIKDSIEILSDNGFKHIELTGGTNYYADLETDIVRLKNQYNLEYLCHNYFPPPREPFVVNLASLDVRIYEKSLDCLKESIEFSKKNKIGKFGFHAGFFIDLKIDELGKNIHQSKISDRDKSLKKFCDAFNILKDFAGNLELYLENNIISPINLKTFKGINPFMLTNYEEYKEIKRRIDFKLLLDIAHLRISCNSLGLNFDEELDKLINFSDYLHLSESNGKSDQHRLLPRNSYLWKVLKKYSLKNKIIVLEARESIAKIKKTYSLLKYYLNVEETNL